MLRGHENNWLRRGVADFAMALALFWAVAFYISGDHNRAHAIAAPRIGKETILNAAITRPANWQSALTGRASRTWAAEIDRQSSLVVPSVAFAAIVALNLAFWRHLRRAYASPRRSVWRRGR